MSPLKSSEAKKDSFTFMSFLQCNRHSKSASSDSGYTSVRKNFNANMNSYVDNNDVVVIDDDSYEPDFEMLCEVEFDPNNVLPLPIEQSITCKTEPENIQESIIPSIYSSSLTFVKEESQQNPSTETATPNFHSEREEELLPLCKMEPNTEINESALKGNNYILYICPQCGVNFDTSAAWKIHIDSVHNLSDQRTYNFTQQPNNKFQCNKCNAIITRCTLKSVQQHCFTHLPYKVYKCKLCLHEAHSLYLMISHILLHKEREEVDMIEADEESEATQKNTTLEHESKTFISYVCPVCGVSFDAEDGWQAHINFRHNFLEKTAENRYKDHFKCSECNVEIFSQHVADLQQHLFTHLPYKSYLKCKLCNWTVSRRNFMISHIFNMHKDNLSCAATAVDKHSISLPNVFNYEEDTSETVAADSLPVATAQKNLSNSMVLETLRRTTGFRCTNCELTFASAALRNEHTVNNHGKYVCKKCDENFAIKFDMLRHKCSQKIPMQCAVCFKEYNYEKCYHRHVRRCHLTLRKRTQLGETNYGNDKETW